MAFLGWYDPDKKRPAVEKLDDAIIRYLEKFGSGPVLCLCNPIEAEELAEGPHGNVEVRGVPLIPRHTFYIGVEDVPAGEEGAS